MSKTPNTCKLLKISGIATLIFGAALLFVFPTSVGQDSNGIASPILAFEFAQTPQEIANIFTFDNVEAGHQFAKKMWLGNVLDFIFMVIYSAFLGLFSWHLYQYQKSKSYLLAIILAVVILIGDVLENLSLFQIQEAFLSGLDFSKALVFLQITTWTKWSSIAVVLFILMLFLRTSTDKYIRLSAYLLLLPFLLLPFAWLRGGWFITQFSNGITLSFLLLTTYAFKASCAQYFITQKTEV